MAVGDCVPPDYVVSLTPWQQGNRSMRRASIILALLTVALPASANSPTPYAGQHLRPLKALSAGEIDDLRNGRGMGLAKAAELNSYPGPAHVLELQGALSLTPSQIERTERLRARMTREAAALGESILQAEAALDRLFGEGKADAAAVERASVEIGTLQGRLRAVHLNTHIEMKALLSADQISAYDRLRGYSGSESRPQGHDGHRH